MNSLIYTCIYNNLWGTEFGGRPSRKEHYKYSLLNILNLNANKYICFTSQNDIEELHNFFYNINNVSSEKLEFVVFDLENTKYFEEIKKIKDIEKIKKTDRCYEVQYNKFFWIDFLEKIETYDRIFWFDAGLSHGGIINEKYSEGNGYDKNFKFNVFNPDYLERICQVSDDKVLILSKNNTGVFYWSSSLPQKYYKEYNRDEHIVGGFFGGSPQKMIEYKEKFEELLKKLLLNEKDLYYEELIMTCLYFNYKDFFTVWKFDDWYNRNDPEKYGDYVRYFSNIMEIPKTCICTLAVEISEESNKYIKSAKKLIDSNLKYTNFDILVVTNRPNEFKCFSDARVKIFDYYKNFEETITSSNKFNMHLKRYPIKIAKKLGYHVIFYNDCDCYITGWNDQSFEEKIKQDFDVFFVSHANPQLGGLRKTYKHFQDKIDNELQDLYTEEMDMAPNPAETRIIFKNNDKLSKFLSFWDLISDKNKNFMTYYDGVYFGTSAIYSKMNMGAVIKSDIFSKYCYIDHGGGTLTYFGEKI
jgi:hypothetical protein